MANPEHLKILKQGVEASNRWREEWLSRERLDQYSAAAETGSTGDLQQPSRKERICDGERLFISS